MSSPLFSLLGGAHVTPADSSAASPKGGPVDGRGASTDFAALLNAGVASAADEQRPALPECAASSFVHTAARASAATPLSSRGQRRGDARDRASSQAAVVSAPSLLSQPVVLSPTGLAVDPQPQVSSSDRSAKEPVLSDAVVPGPEPARAPSPRPSLSSEPAAAPEGLGVPVATPAASVLFAKGPGAAATAAAIPGAPPAGAVTATTTATTPNVPTNLVRTPTPATTTGAGTPTATTTAKPTPAAQRPAPTGVSVPAHSPAVAAPTALAPAPQTRLPVAAPASTANATEPPGADAIAGTGGRAVLDSSLGVDVALEPPRVAAPSTSAFGGATIDVTPLDLPSDAVAAPREPTTIVAPSPVTIDPTWHTRAAKADVVALAPPGVGVTAKPQGRTSTEAGPTKNTTGLMTPTALQPMTPAPAHVGAVKPAVVDHGSTGDQGAAAAPGAARSKPEGATAASSDTSPQPAAHPEGAPEVAVVDAARPAKTVTVVTKTSPAAAAPPAAVGARLRDALVSVANHAVLRGEATGQIDVPELGRIAVRAHSAGGTVDVVVTADEQAARATLRGHAGAIAADLHAADVPVGRLTIDRAGASFGDSPGNSMTSRDRGGSTSGDSPRDDRSQSEGDSAPTAVDAIAPRRVRIVL